MPRTQRKTQAIKKRMRELRETEDQTRDYILAQVDYFVNEIEDKGRATVEQWIGFKLRCSVPAATEAIEWAQQQWMKKATHEYRYSRVSR